VRRLLFRSAIGILGLVALLVVWIAGARALSLLLDRVHTVEIESRPVTQLGVADADHGMLLVNDLPMNTSAPDDSAHPLKMNLDSERQFILKKADRSIVLGRADSLFAVKPSMGDRARLKIERSMLSWPTLLEINFMTGHSPSWKRHLYYRLIWEKPRGARLEMVWRYEQYFYDDWASGFMTRAGTTGLIHVDIRP
jgi:hypothetical protein